MNFTCSTKPLKDALGLGVVKSNVSKFYQKSCLAQLTATNSDLRINLEASYVSTELRLKGQGDNTEDSRSTVFVDCLTLSDLVNTFESSTITLEFTQGGLILHSGKSKFTLPQIVEESDLELKRPQEVSADADKLELAKSNWKFIKDHQMFAIAMSFIHPVYTKVWVGSDGDVLVGDFDNSIFTHSSKSNLGSQCLLSDTIVNLFNSLPEGAKISKQGTSYIVQVSTDGFDYTSEFTPQSEEDEGVGSYNSEIILEMLETSADKSIQVNVPKINKFLNQSTLLSHDSENTIDLIVDGVDVQLKDNNVDCKLTLPSAAPENYTCKFKTVLLKSMMANFDEENISIMPMKQEGDAEGEEIIVGVVAWTPNMSVVLAGVEE